MKNENAYEVTRVEHGIVYDEFLSLPENCGMEIMTKEKVKTLISELNKRNRNRDDVIIIDTISEGIGIIYRHD